jgi:dTDP-4-dehydrorhamnose 3,5-epimerase
MALNQVTEIKGVQTSTIKVESDRRGSFLKFEPAKLFGKYFDSTAISINPNPGTIRGLHFQVEPFAEEKLITCVQGAIFDVIVDLRENSETFGKWAFLELNAQNSLQIFVPKGVAHGFQTLLPDSIVHYVLGTAYAPDFSYSIDPFGDLDVSWPLAVHSISKKDLSGIPFSVASQKYSNSLRS